MDIMNEQMGHLGREIFLKGQAEILDLKTTTLHLDTPKENVSKLKESNRNAIHSEAEKNERLEKIILESQGYRNENKHFKWSLQDRIER